MPDAYPLTYDVDYPDRQLNRLTSALRVAYAAILVTDDYPPFRLSP